MAHQTWASVILPRDEAGIGWILRCPCHEFEKNPELGSPKCAACQFGKQVQCADHTTVQFKNPECEGALKEGQLQPGDRVFTDQLKSKVRADFCTRLAENKKVTSSVEAQCSWMHHQDMCTLKTKRP
jgi:hypothetical protein